MGNWFENMEKMDIQAKRHNTQEAQAKLAQAERELSDAKNKFLQDIIITIKECSGTKEQAMTKLTNQYGKNEAEAMELVKKYW